MRIRSIELGEDEQPVSLTAELSVDEAALLYAYAGRTTDLHVEEATGDAKWVEVNTEIAGCVFSFFNRFFANGPSDVLDARIVPR